MTRLRERNGHVELPADYLREAGEGENFGSPRYVAFGGEWGDTFVDAGEDLPALLAVLKEGRADVVVWHGDRVAALVLGGRVIIPA
jgi:hypothetical protein